ncbi:hypothetical protein Tco_0172667 [Tanacetum coccineum]
MITPTDHEPAQEVKHIWYDVCNCESCLEEAKNVDDDEDLPKKRKSLQQKLKRRYEKGDPTVRILGEPLGKFDYYSENVVAQNKVLVKILSQQSMIINTQENFSSTVRSLESIISELRFKV